MVHQRRDPVQDGAPQDDFCGLQGAATGEHRQALEQALLVFAQQIVAPLDGPSQRLLARRQVARAAGQQRQPTFQVGEHGLRREMANAHRRQLNGEREPI